jgi:hypothetical protein
MKKTVTWVGTEGYYLTKEEIKKLKNILRVMAKVQGVHYFPQQWKSYAARPEIVKHWISLFDKHGQSKALEIIESEAQRGRTTNFPKKRKKNFDPLSIVGGIQTVKGLMKNPKRRKCNPSSCKVKSHKHRKKNPLLQSVMMANPPKRKNPKSGPSIKRKYQSGKTDDEYMIDQMARKIALDSEMMGGSNYAIFKPSTETEWGIVKVIGESKKIPSGYQYLTPQTIRDWASWPRHAHWTSSSEPVRRQVEQIARNYLQHSPIIPFGKTYSDLGYGKKNPASGPADEPTARELLIYIDNDADLYRQQLEPIQKNLVNKMAAGKYDRTKAKKLMMYLVDSGARKYTNLHGGGPRARIDEIFNKNTRLITAGELVESFENEAELGNYDYLLYKKYGGKAEWVGIDNTVPYPNLEIGEIPKPETDWGRPSSVDERPEGWDSYPSQENPRKVHEQIVNAFLAGKKKKIGNYRTDGKTLWLHGHPIANITDDATLVLSDEGYQTPTTKATLNAVLYFGSDFYPAHGIFQKGGRWFIGKGFSGSEDPQQWTGGFNLSPYSHSQPIEPTSRHSPFQGVRKKNPSQKLTTSQRRKLPASVFGLPKSRRYPMQNKGHAISAKAYAKQELDKGYLSQADYNKVVRKANKILRSYGVTPEEGFASTRKKNPQSVWRRKSSNLYEQSQDPSIKIKITGKSGKWTWKVECGKRKMATGIAPTKLSAVSAAKSAFTKRKLRKEYAEGGKLLHNPTSKPPFREGEKVKVAEARAWIKSTGNKSLLKDFEKALKLQTKANRTPKFVEWRTLPIGSKNKLDSITALVEYGKSDETYYKPPKGSKKGTSDYVHEWGDGSGKSKPVPMYVSANGKLIINKLGKGQRATDWLRG